MVLKTLGVMGPQHGYGTARRIEQVSDAGGGRRSAPMGSAVMTSGELAVVIAGDARGLAPAASLTRASPDEDAIGWCRGP